MRAVLLLIIMNLQLGQSRRSDSKVGGRGEPRNLANGAAEFGKICRGKLWSLLISTKVVLVHGRVDVKPTAASRLIVLLCITK